MSDSDDSALKVKVQVDGAEEAASEIKWVKQSVDEASDSTKKISDSSKEASSSMREFLRSGSEARLGISELEAASQGGIRGLFGLAGAFRSFIGFVRTTIGASGPIGLLIVALGAIIGLFLSMKKGAEEAGDGIKKNAESTEDLRKKLEALEEAAKKEGETQIEALKKIHDGYDQELSDIDAAMARTEKLREANKKLAEDQLESARQDALKSAKTPEEKAKIEDSFNKQKADLEEDNSSATAETKRAQAANKLRVLNEKKAADEKALTDARKTASEADEKIEQAREEGSPALRENESISKNGVPNLGYRKIYEENKRQIAAGLDTIYKQLGFKKAAQDVINAANKDLDETNRKIEDVQAEFQIAGIEDQDAAIEKANKDKAIDNEATDRAKKIAEEKAKQANEENARAQEKANSEAKKSDAKDAYEDEVNAEANVADAQLESLPGSEERHGSKSSRKSRHPSPAGDGSFSELPSSPSVSSARGSGDPEGSTTAFKEAAAKVPPPLDPSKLLEAFKAYQAKIVDMQTQNAKALDAVTRALAAELAQIEKLAQQVQQQASQISTLARQISNMRTAS
jgi:hypothetical protein